MISLNRGMMHQKRIDNICQLRCLSLMCLWEDHSIVFSVISFLVEGKMPGVRSKPPYCDIPNTIKTPVLQVGCMAASYRRVSVSQGTIYRIYHYLSAKEPVKKVPFLGVFGNMYGFCSQFHSQIVHKFKRMNNSLISGRDLVKIVSMGD